MISLRMMTLLFLCVLVQGCFSYASVSRDSKNVTPVTYSALENVRMERSVGKLRRLAVLPVQLEVSPEDPKLCPEKCGWEGLDRVIEAEVVLSLRQKRGYDVLSDEILMREDGPAFSSEELSNHAKELAGKAREGNPDLPPPEVVALVKELGRRADVDGIVVIQGKATSWTLLDWAAMYASFTLSSPLSYVRVGISLRADVFEVSTGRIVWTGKLSGWGEPSAGGEYGKVIIEHIEPAIPQALTRPREGSKDDGERPSAKSTSAPQASP